jgi:hypothetical protein
MPEDKKAHPPNLLDRYHAVSSDRVWAVGMPYPPFCGIKPRTSGIAITLISSDGIKKGWSVIFLPWRYELFDNAIETF